MSNILNVNLTKYISIYYPIMQNTFEEKRKRLLSELKILALKHNRDYYTSMIPFVEHATPDQEDLIHAYQYALDEDRAKLFQSRDAMATVEKVQFLI